MVPNSFILATGRKVILLRRGGGDGGDDSLLVVGAYVDSLSENVVDASLDSTPFKGKGKDG